MRNICRRPPLVFIMTIKERNEIVILLVVKRRDPVNVLAVLFTLNAAQSEQITLRPALQL